MNAPHLTDDALDEIILGIESSDATLHLAACHACTQRLEHFQAQLGVFNQASLGWSEARANTISRDLSAHKSSWRLTLPTAWASAATVVLALTLGVTAQFQRESGTASADKAVVAGTTQAYDPQHQIADDNAMLAAIDSEMSTPDPGQFALYQPVSATVSSMNGQHAGQEQD